MDDTGVCGPLFAESDSQNNTTSTPNAASVTDVLKVINTKIDNTQVEGNNHEEDLLKGLLTDDYCHVCEAVLLFESQRISHYEGKKHAQKIKVYLQTKSAEKNKESTGSQRVITIDKDRFCKLCNMVFSSQVVAKSHYEGKVHTKNLRKQGLQPPVIDKYTEVHHLSSLALNPDNGQISAPLSDMVHFVEPEGSTTTPSTDVDLKGRNKYCALCAASFNNPQMALQHYIGRKHRRNQARQELIKKLGEDVQQANSLMCQTCSVQFNSVEMYQAHMQGNKHQIREKKVTDLCNTQQKVYSNFADELADYIQVQKARGIIPKSNQVLPQGDSQQENEVKEQEINTGDVTEPNKLMSSLPPSSNTYHQSHSVCNSKAEEWNSSYHGSAWPPFGRFSPVFQDSGSPKFSNCPIKKRRHRQPSSSSSYTTSSSSSNSSYSSSTSDSDDSDYKNREKCRNHRSTKGRDRRLKEKEQSKRKRHSREKYDDCDERRTGISGESRQDMRKIQKNHGKRRRKEKEALEVDLQKEVGETMMNRLKTEHIMYKQAEVHIKAGNNVEDGDGRHDESPKPKYKKEKKKMKAKVDSRTEEEKLWDDSILGC